MNENTFEERQYPLPSKVVQANIDALTSREALGLRKYGHTLDRRDLNHRDFLQHGLEEALDLANYLQAAIQRSDTSTRAYKDLLQRMEKIVAEEHLNGVRSSTEITKQLMLAIGDHKFRFPSEAT